MSLQRPPMSPSDVAFLQYTGGTTGVSKGATLTHRNVIANILQTEAWFKPMLDKQTPLKDRPGRDSPVPATGPGRKSRCH